MAVAAIVQFCLGSDTAKFAGTSGSYYVFCHILKKIIIFGFALLNVLVPM